MARSIKIKWEFDKETRFPFGRISPDPERYDLIGFPPVWPDRPWIYAVMVASANGVVAWQREGPGDDPVRTILGGDDTRAERIADLRQMRFYRIFGDVAIGAQTTRDQPDIVQTPREPGEAPVPELYRFRADHGLPYHPRHVVYSLFGRLHLENRMFNEPGIEVIVVTTEAGAGELARRGAAAKGISLIVEPLLEPDGLVRAHQRLFADRGVRYLDCEGGETVLRALHAAELLDEVFVTTTDVVIDESKHEGMLKIFDFAEEGAELIAEGRIAPDSGYTFRRWRFNRR